jgi:hypothetical protein
VRLHAEVVIQQLKPEMSVSFAFDKNFVQMLLTESLVAKLIRTLTAEAADWTSY